MWRAASLGIGSDKGKEDVCLLGHDGSSENHSIRHNVSLVYEIRGRKLKCISDGRCSLRLLSIQGSTEYMNVLTTFYCVERTFRSHCLGH